MGEKSQQIPGTSFSIEFVLAKLRDGGFMRCSPRNLDSFQLQDISGGSAFMSRIYKLQFNWKEDQEKSVKPSSIVLKIPGTEGAQGFFEAASDNGPTSAEDLNEVDGFLMLVHAREMLFYQLFPPYDNRLKMPKYYYGYEFNPSHRKGVIIMEDMSPSSTTIPMLPGANDQQAVAMMKAMARFHAASWNNREWMQHLPNIPHNQGFIEKQAMMIGQLKKLKPEWFDSLVDKMLPYCTPKTFEMSYYTEDKYGFKSSLVHGDLWSPNVLWRRDEAQEHATAEVTAIIDWQMLHSGNPFADLARFLGFTTAGDYRRANTERLLGIYANKVAECSPAGKAPFDKEMMLTAYKATLLPVAVVMGFGAPMYHEMESVVGKRGSKECESKQLELLTRVKMFFEDALATRAP